MLCENLEDRQLISRQTLDSKILNLQLQNGMFHSIFNGFQQPWSENLS